MASSVICPKCKRVTLLEKTLGPKDNWTCERCNTLVKNGLVVVRKVMTPKPLGKTVEQVKLDMGETDDEKFQEEFGDRDEEKEEAKRSEAETVASLMNVQNEKGQNEDSKEEDK